VGISWYEAEAYCAWLNLTPEGRQHKPEGMKAQLPSQEQWMRAAHNGRRAPAKEEDYPWRGPFDQALANTEESNLGQTTPVDMYPDGATPAGVCDLEGNVWEWTADAYGKERNAFYLKGGSWGNNADAARASAADFWDFDWNWDDYYGFRVVCVPISHG
jgi:formylglycine-generating enzyme required for sulfatase activity